MSVESLDVVIRRIACMLTHERKVTDEQITVVAKVPEFLTQAYSKSNWDKMKAIFESRKAAGFPGHEPIA